jgi:hypothetical protein
MRAAVVDLETDIVVNIIVADASRDIAPEGTLLVNLEETSPCSPGWIYDPATGNFMEPFDPDMGA